MNSRIYTGKVMHGRGWPVRHHFHYPVYFYGLDLDELDVLDASIVWFGHNRIRLASIHDRDFLAPGDASLKQKVCDCLASHGIQLKPSRVMLITNARFLNYVFNPVSFFYCFDAADSLQAVIAFVNNTFRESHMYVLDTPLKPRAGFAAHFQTTKAFHVSPFFDVEGYYDFHFSLPGDSVDVLIQLSKEDRHVFSARLSGTGRELTAANLVKTVSRYPLTAALTFPRITWQAAKLHVRKKLPVYRKPIPESTDTVRFAPPKRIHRWAMEGVLATLENIEHGHLEMTLPNREKLTLGDENHAAAVSISVNRYDFFWRLAAHGDTGLGEAYMAGDWDCPDITAFLALLGRNSTLLRSRPQWPSAAARSVDTIGHLCRANTIGGSRRNIHRHYDLSNEFFQLFLDPSMTYSCARYAGPGDSLERAQKNKLVSIIEKADIKPEHHVLEVGCGWGSFAIEAARQTGCRVTGITVSDEQVALATKRVQQAGLEGRVTIEKRDYRHLDRQFDRIVSIEMLEAVGHRYLDTFFEAMNNALKPEGRLVIQVITIPEQRYRQYRCSSDWIRKYIFPGGHLPSLTALSAAAAKASDLIVDHVENIGDHYAPTLRQWHDNLLQHMDDAKKLGLDDGFLRKWEYYFCYCEAGFATRMLNDLQLVMRPAGP